MALRGGLSLAGLVAGWFSFGAAGLEIAWGYR